MDQTGVLKEIENKGGLFAYLEDKDIGLRNKLVAISESNKHLSERGAEFSTYGQILSLRYALNNSPSSRIIDPEMTADVERLIGRLEAFEASGGGKFHSQYGLEENLSEICDRSCD